MRAGGRLAIGIMVLLGGCAHSELTLFPGENGARTGAVAVLDPATGEDRAIVDQANSRTRIAGGKARTKLVTPSAADTATLGYLPPAAMSYTVYFLEGTTRLTPASEPMMKAISADIAARTGAEVQIVGHTDRVGGSADNVTLSIKRAEQVRATLLEKLGLKLEDSRVSGRGELEPRVPTADGVAEPRNRRVEIIVR